MARLIVAASDLAAAVVVCCWCDRIVGVCRCDLALLPAPFDPQDRAVWEDL